MTKKKDEKRPLDMTTDEAINFLFEKPLVEGLKETVNESNKDKKKKSETGLTCSDDSTYKYDN